MGNVVHRGELSLDDRPCLGDDLFVHLSLNAKLFNFVPPLLSTVVGEARCNDGVGYFFFGDFEGFLLALLLGLIFLSATSC